MKISEDLNTIVLPVLKAVPKPTKYCHGCYFKTSREIDWAFAPVPCVQDLCVASHRKDGQEVIFVEVKDENQ